MVSIDGCFLLSISSTTAAAARSPCCSKECFQPCLDWKSQGDPTYSECCGRTHCFGLCCLDLVGGFLFSSLLVHGCRPWCRTFQCWWQQEQNGLDPCHSPQLHGQHHSRFYHAINGTTLQTHCSRLCRFSHQGKPSTVGCAVKVLHTMSHTLLLHASHDNNPPLLRLVW